MRIKVSFVLFVTIVFLLSCRDDFNSIQSSGNLTFSKDTVFLDTVFSNIGSITYNLKVYNKSNKNITIPSVRLAKGEASYYRIQVDGKPGKIFNNIEILAKDSIFIFIETTINYNQVSNPIYIDEILFESESYVQNVKLVTLVQDAHFLFPSKNAQGIIETISIGESLKINGFYFNNNVTFTNNKPYVIYGYAAVPENKTLTIEEGAKIYFHSNSGLIISKNATLKVEGTLSKKVVFEGDHLEHTFSNTPGQWGTIWLRSGSKNSSIKNAVIKNGTVGILSDSINSIINPALTLKNVEIYNNSNFGILGRETSIYGENVVVNNSGQSSLACTIGGTYSFIHCTFTNFLNNGFREYPAVLINNYFKSLSGNSNIIETRNLAVNFTNCIIDGNNNIEFLLDKVEGSAFNFKFSNNLLKFNDPNKTYANLPQYDFNNTTNYVGNILNGNADFKSPSTNLLKIGVNSDAKNKASINGTQQVPHDILGILRSSPADIGAYQH
ncbi:hypothetical protein [Lutibacter sp.]|uniref:hypothetical protein n=1 Tax=Lutibacter sp. TaxID=1925666 RepID=UPI002736BE92|nr:hypothetical protein [Lutibacter sp.]MDP3311987.1 hypothetical protein [Lutibacter sp.]